MPSWRHTDLKAAACANSYRKIVAMEDSASYGGSFSHNNWDISRQGLVKHGGGAGGVVDHLLLEGGYEERAPWTWDLYFLPILVNTCLLMQKLHILLKISKY